MDNATLFDALPDPDNNPKNEDARAGTPSGSKENGEMNSSKYRPLMPAVRRNAPHTSREAARRAVPFFNAQRAKVLAFVIEQGLEGTPVAEIASWRGSARRPTSTGRQNTQG